MLVAFAAWARWSAPRVTPALEDGADERIGWRRILLWLALSAVPSGLLLSTTSHLTTCSNGLPVQEVAGSLRAAQ